MRLFVDTSALVALANSKDKHNVSAVEFREKLRSSSSRATLLIISNYVFDETITLLRVRIGHAYAISFGKSLKDSELFRIHWLTPEVDELAWDIFVKYSDKDYSYTDCTSFALMKAEGIDTVFGYDDHFRQFGFQQVP